MNQDQQEQEQESQLNQDVAQAQQQESTSGASSRQAPKMDVVDLALGLFVAAIFDLLSFIPLIGNIISVAGIGALWLWLWLKGVKRINIFGGVGMGIEAIPILSALPANIAFVVVAFLMDRVVSKIVKKLPAPVKKVASVAVMPTKSPVKTQLKRAA